MLVIDCPNDRKIRVAEDGIYLNDKKIDSLDELTEDERKRLYMSMVIIKDIANGTA